MISKPIAELMRIQARDKLSDEKMAERLGCTRTLWYFTRTGKSPLAAKMIRGIVRSFPELHTCLLVFLANDGDEKT